MSYNKTTTAKKADYKAKIKELKEKVKSATPEEMADFAKSWVSGYVHGLHRYSFYNYMIANFQLRRRGKTLSAIAPFKKWSELNRSISAGEKAVHVFAPIIVKKKDDETDEEEKRLVGYRLVPVFDISQTNGDLSKLNIEKGGLVGDWTAGKSNISFDKLVEVFNIPTVKDIISPNGGNGWTDGKEIHLIPQNNEQDIATYIHELAHYMLHFDKDRATFSSEVKEVEAETVSYIVCDALGFENKTSKLYIKNHAGDIPEDFRTMKIISVCEKIMSTIMDNSETKMV